MAQPKFKKPPPKRSANRGIWVDRIEPLCAHPGRWALIFTAETVEQAQNAVDNLNRRRVRIPRPDHNWGFVSRDLEVYAEYRGPGRKRASVRRTQRKR